MHVPYVPTPDEFFKYILIKVFGQGALIVALFLLAYSIWSWYKWGKRWGQRAFKFGGAAVDAGGRVYSRLFELGPVGTVLGFVISVVVLALQAIWLNLSYLIGNGLSWFLIGDRPRIGNGPDWNPFIADLRWDWVSVVYVVGAAATLLLAYEAAFHADRQEAASRAMMILTVPLIIVGALSGLSAVVAGVIFAINRHHDQFMKDFPLKTLALVAVVVGVYIVASRTIARSPALIVQVWRPVHDRDSESDSYRDPDTDYLPEVRVPRRTIMPTMVIIGVVLAIIIAMGVGRGHSNQIAQPRPSVASEFPPLHTKLICDPNIGGVVCHGALHWASVLALSVRGLTPEVVSRLCADGYKSKWSQNRAGYIMNPTMCQDPNAATLDEPDFSGGAMTVHFSPPTRKGRWVIVWRLYDHSGRLVRSSRYTARVASF
jgi:hypothetical protein